MNTKIKLIDTLQKWGSFLEYHGIEPDHYDILEKKIGYSFKDRAFLYEAMTHRSALYSYRRAEGLKTTDLPWNERLEFLGDSVLELCISKILWHDLPTAAEGKLSKIRSFLVSEARLAQVAQNMDLEKFLILGKTEKKQVEQGQASLIADSLEALIGAIYLDSSIEVMEKLSHQWFASLFKEDYKDLMSQDHKSTLQEITQDLYKKAPEYETLESTGPDHQKKFKIGVFLNNQKIAQGWGDNKKKASQEAAKSAIQKIHNLKITTQ